MTEEEIRFLDAQDYWGLMNLNMQYAISHRERVMRREPISFPEYERSLGGDAILLKRAVQHGQQQSNATKEEQITFLLNFLRKTGEERMTQSMVRNEWQIFCRLYNELFSPVLALQAIAEVYGLDAEKLLKREYASANRESTGIYSLSTF